MAEIYGPCVWSACPHKAIDAVLEVHLIYEGRSFVKKRVPLCGEHLTEFGRSKRMVLRSEFLISSR